MTTKKIKVFEVEINPSMNKTEIQLELEKISDTVEIEISQNRLKQDVIEVARGQGGSQTIYEVVFNGDNLQYIVKIIRETIFQEAVN